MEKWFKQITIISGCLLLISGCICTAPMPSDMPPHTSEVVVPTNPPQPLVVTGVEYHLDDGERCKVDVRLPKANSSISNADKLNKVIETEFSYTMTQTDINAWETSSEYEYTWHQYDYLVTNFDDVYSISVINTISSAYGSYQPWQWVWSFYYDASQGDIITIEQFLEKVGYTKDEIISTYISTYCPARRPEEINVDKLLYYFDEYRQLKFIFNPSAFNRLNA